MSKLLPCPFCGGKASTTKGHERSTQRPVFKAFCLDCQNRTVSVESRVAAESLWNRRYEPDGWQCVPKEPTPAMVESGCEAYGDCYRSGICYGDCHCSPTPTAWSAMLSVAPSPNDTPSHTAETTDNQESDK